MARSGSAPDGFRELKRRVGDGRVVGQLLRDQVYAAYIEDREDLRHPHGGVAHAQQNTLMENADTYMRMFAEEFGRDFDPVSAMDTVVQRYRDDVVPHIPVDLHILQRSGHAQVLQGDRVVRDHPPEVPRLSEQELEQLHRGRRLDEGDESRRRSRLGTRGERRSDRRELERGRTDPVVGERLTREGERRGRNA